MTRVYTERQAQFPSKLDILRVLDKRNAIDEEQKEELAILEAKNIAYNQMIAAVNKHGGEDWRVLADVSLRILTDAECDFILVNQTGVHFFQIYNTKISTLKEQVNQAREIHHAYTDFFNDMNIQFHINGAVVVPDFIYNNILQTSDERIEVISASLLEQHFLDLAAHEINSMGDASTIHEILHWLGEIDSKSGFMSVYISDELEAKIQGGILCKNCWNLNLFRHEEEIVCPCGKIEHHEEAILRAIDDYTIIHKDDSLNPLAVYHALWQEGKLIEYEEVINVLNKNYRAISYSPNRITMLNMEI